MDAILTVEGVSMHFGGIRALDGVSLEVIPGRVTGLIGPNGSGKSTLFNVITGFLKPDEGEVRFQGQPIQGLPPHRIAHRGIHRSFQSSLNPRQMTVLESMLLCPRGQVGEGLVGTVLRFGRVRRQEEEALERAWPILERVKLGEKANEYVGSLSGGQKKLLSLAQALMVRPRIILLDEPVAGVNPRLIDDIQEVILDLRAEGQTFLVVEHNMQVIRRICDRVCVLDAGKVLAEGPPEEALSREEVLRAYLAAPRADGQVPGTP